MILCGLIIYKGGSQIRRLARMGLSVPIAAMLLLIIRSVTIARNERGPPRCCILESPPE
jgi:hypothetical protein